MLLLFWMSLPLLALTQFDSPHGHRNGGRRGNAGGNGDLSGIMDRLGLGHLNLNGRGGQGIFRGGGGRNGGPRGPARGGRGGGRNGRNRRPPNRRRGNNRRRNKGIVEEVMRTVHHITQNTAHIVAVESGVDVLGDLKKWRRGGKRPNKRAWKKKARRFCRRFPGHKSCRRGKLPQYGDLANMINGLVGRSLKAFLPKVPRMRIRDPLARVDRKLRKLLGRNYLNLGFIDMQAVNNMRSGCRRIKCREQSEKTIKAKQLVQEKIFAFEQATVGKDTTDAIQLRLDRTQQLKEALLEKANLTTEVIPADNGVFDSDILLTEEQANFMLNDLGQGGVGADFVPHPDEFSDAEDDSEEVAKEKARKRRASLYFEENLVKKWDLTQPIQYVLGTGLNNIEKNDVRQAVAEIERKSCIRFREIGSPPSTHHLHYNKYDSPTFCGLSYVGRAEPANPIFLSFQCGNTRGVALHETLHALGVAHQHLRPDRDQHLTIDWSNVNPQMYDSFAVLEGKLYTSYGVAYDYGSIMHYNAYTAAINVVKPTMIPKRNPSVNTGVLGQRREMSTADVTLLNKMYCIPGCADANVFCGAWSLQGHCATNSWISTNCKNSCNSCNG